MNARTPLSAAIACTLAWTAASAQTITSVAPSSISVADRFIVEGAGFGSEQAGSQLLVGGDPAIISFWSDTRIRAHLPAGAVPGASLVQVRTLSPGNTVPVTIVPRPAPSGRIRWRVQTDHYYSMSRPAVAPDGTIYHTGVAGPMYSISPQGEVRWAIRNAGGMRPATVGPDGTVYFLGAGATITAANQAGEVLWQYNAPSNAGPMFVGPGVGPDGKIYAVTEEEPSLGTSFGAFALNPDGSLAWNTPGGYNFRASPLGWEVAFAGDKAVFATGQGGPVTGNPGVHALNISSGQEQWTRAGISKVQAAAGNLYWLGAINNNYIGSYERAGDERWTIVYNTFFGQPGGFVVAPDGTSFYNTSTGARHAVLNANGSIRWQASPGYVVHAYGALRENSAFIAVAYLNNPVSLRLRAYSAGDGSILWEEILPFENEVHMGPHWEGNLSPDGRTFYLSLTGNNTIEDPYCYFIAVDVGESCYANCDASIFAPVLTPNDFACFLNRYAAGESWANCDGVAAGPGLSANDFVCFLNHFAAGCP